MIETGQLRKPNKAPRTVKKKKKKKSFTKSRVLGGFFFSRFVLTLWFSCSSHTAVSRHGHTCAEISVKLQTHVSTLVRFPVPGPLKDVL